ncbi:MAG: hypothetical protein ACRD9S_16835 [Pyrinomonadaceae bacterium]
MSSRLQKLFRPSKGSNTSSLPPLVRFLIPALLVCSFGCGKDLFNSLTELAQLRNALIKEFHEQNIDVTIQNSTNLAVTFVNSPLNAYPDELPMRAQETAFFIKRHYVGIDRLESILVRFLKNETRNYVITYTEEIDSFMFGKDAVLIGAPPEYNPRAFKGPGDVNVNYNATRNESEVGIMRLQLEGNTEKGVVLSPHFKVRGDASIAGHTIGIPSAVIFDFASFAPEKVFKEDPVLKLVADGIAIYNDKAHNLNATTTGGNEFLVQAIPLAQFLKVADAKTVVLTLGNREYLLSEEQLEALRDMATYANSGRKR